MELLLGTALGTVALFVWGFHRLGKRISGPRDRAREHLRKLTRSRASDVHTGRACAVVGRVLPPDRPLKAPVSGVDCAAWELRIWISRFPDSRYDASQMILIARASEVASITVEDDSGVVRVDPARAVPLLKGFESTLFRTGLPDEVVDILKRQRQPTAGSFMVDEAVLNADDTIVVGGVASVEADPSGQTTDYRTAPTRAVLRSSRRLPLCLSNDPQIVKGNMR